MLRVPFERMHREFERILREVGLSGNRASLCARILAENSLVGVSSHGLNRFPQFVDAIRRGIVKVDAEPVKLEALGAWERWNGNSGLGPLNAVSCTKRSMELAREYGIGCVALNNTNHWMRGGTYGWMAAEAGFQFICWTNTQPNMPPWGAKGHRLGNNPLVIAVPRKDGHVILDMAMSQYSYGNLETFERYGKKLQVYGGFDIDGQMTKDPGAIIESARPFPIGFWKGSGLALVLDLMAALLSGGLTTVQIGRKSEEYDVSQVFIAFDISKSNRSELINEIVDEVIEDMHSAGQLSKQEEILYPGERALGVRNENLRKGIPVDESVWQEVLNM